MPPPKLFTSVPDWSNLRIGGSILPAQVLAPHRSATQMLVPSRSTSTALVDPHIRPAGSLNQFSTVRNGLGCELGGASASALAVASAATAIIAPLRLRTTLPSSRMGVCVSSYTIDRSIGRISGARPFAFRDFLMYTRLKILWRPAMRSRGLSLIVVALVALASHAKTQPMPRGTAADGSRAEVEATVEKTASAAVSDRDIRVVRINGEYNVGVGVVDRAKTIATATGG